MSPSKTERDTRIDFIRGFFILMMAMDHFDYLVALLGSKVTTKVYTYQSIGWSSAAEFFVFFSGYIIAIVYAKTLVTRGFWLTQLRAAHRAWELYVRNALVWLLAVASMAWLFRGDQALFAVTKIAGAARYADAGLLEFMTMRYSPVYFEILPLYMILMLLAPAFLWCHARHRWLAIAVSAGVWLLVQIDPAVNLHTPGPWNFNPFAWQFVFFLGMWFSKEKPLTRFNRERRASKIAIVVGVLLLCAAVKALDKAQVVLPLIGEIAIPDVGKSNVEALRLAHFLVVIYLVGLVMPSNDWVVRRAATRAVALVGTHSLDCFSLSILLGYLSLGVFSLSARGNLDYFALEAVNVVGLLLAAVWFAWLKTPPWRAPPGGRAASPAPAPAGLRLAGSPGV